MRTVTRREMIALLGLGVAAATTSVPTTMRALVHDGTRGVSQAELEAWVSAQLAHADVKAIAAAWRQAHPAESTAAPLARAILAGRRAGEPLGDFLARAVAAEHRDGRAEVVDGWYLAPTEARLATLFDLGRGGTR